MTRLLCAALIAGLCNGVGAQPVDMPDDFAFRLEFGCVPDLIDSVTGEYVKYIDGDRKAVARVRLSDSQKQHIYLLLLESKFFTYPERFRPTAVISEPGDTYRLEVRAAGQRHTVLWNDTLNGEDSNSEEAVRLRTFLRAIITTYQQMPAVQRLPPREVFCL